MYNKGTANKKACSCDQEDIHLHLSVQVQILLGYSHKASGKEPTRQCKDTGDADSIPGSGRTPGGGNGNPLRNSCLENPMDGGAWRATVHRVAKRHD